MGWAKWLHHGFDGFRIDQDFVGRETSTGAISNSLCPIFDIAQALRQQEGVRSGTVRKILMRV